MKTYKKKYIEVESIDELNAWLAENVQYNENGTAMIQTGKVLFEAAVPLPTFDKMTGTEERNENITNITNVNVCQRTRFLISYFEQL